MRTVRTRELDAGWQFRACDPLLSKVENLGSEQDWMPATVPGTVYQDLIALDRIPDPFFGTNEQDVQWVADRDWCYRLDFDVSPDESQAHVDLVFEGLDTFASVWLNGELILESDNMFVPARVDVRGLLSAGTNRLAIVFESALRRGRERDAIHGRRHLWNGDPSRLYVRKAQYHYGWDWGPVLLTAGPWRPVRLQTYDARIEDVDSALHLAPDFLDARVDIVTTLGSIADPTFEVVHILRDKQGKCVAEARTPARPRTEASLHVTRPQLWWPAGHGAQPLYTLETELRAGEVCLERHVRRIGMRTVQLLQQPVAGERGSSFHFAVNGREIFTGGANWIPDDNLLNRITPERYRERVKQAVDANMMMLRVWGGGIYEDDAFFDACDELGVLVWQDFLFACGIYPAYEDFLASVEAEATAAVKRLRHRASLAIWCGNNEDYAIAESIGLHGRCVDRDKDKRGAGFEARVIYERLLPGICARLDPRRPYWPGSPYSPSTTETLNSDDQTVGDRHSWEVWHGAMLPYQQYRALEARFISEFGMQSHPALALLESVVPEDERFPLSRTMSAHNKAGSGAPDGHRRLAAYVADTLNCGPLLEDAVYATRFVQAEAMRYAFQDFRHRWQKRGARAVGGALVWQLNDCWPATSWAIVDSAGVVKPAWHAIRRALQPLAIAVRVVGSEARCWIASSADAVAATIRLRRFLLDGTALQEMAADLRAAGNASTDHVFELAADARAVVVEASLWVGGRCVARDHAWPEPYRFHRLFDRGITVQRVAGGVVLCAARPAKGVWLSGSGVNFSDNFIDLMPGERVTVSVSRDDAKLRICALDQAPIEIGV
jgi:beta-mannosidase